MKDKNMSVGECWNEMFQMLKEIQNNQVEIAEFMTNNKKEMSITSRGKK